MGVILLCTALLACIDSSAQTRPTQFDFQTQTLSSGTVGNPYRATITLTGGTPPLTFSITSGKLPDGILLQPNSGILSGTPATSGSYRFVVTVNDGTGSRITRSFVINIEDLLSVRWLMTPSLDSNVLSGSIEVSNSSREMYDLTAIVVAVNEIGKAFALGYQHFNLGGQIKQAIPFSSMLPNGRYVIHADAVAEIPVRNVIRRARLQTQAPIIVNVNR